MNDTLVTNLREPILTFVEDTSSGSHDTLIAACDPNRYKQLGAPDWEKHGSCAENLVLALKELNERAGLKGAKGVGAEISVNTVPAPLNLFMNVPWDTDGKLGFGKPKSTPGDYVRFYAERDVVVVMSACPQDLTDINGKEINDAHFIVENVEEPAQALKRTQPRKKSLPRKISSSQAPNAPSATPQKRATELADPNMDKQSPTIRPQESPAGQAQQSAKTTPVRPVKKKPPPPSTQKSAEQGGQSAAATRPRKKPVPPSVGDGTNGKPAPPVERKKPRKLLVKPQASTGI